MRWVRDWRIGSGLRGKEALVWLEYALTARSVLAISNFVLHRCFEFGVSFFQWGSFDVKVADLLSKEGT